MKTIHPEVFDRAADDDDECLDASAAAEKNCSKANCSKCGPQFTAMEELMVCKAYIKTSEDSIHGSKQKIALFKAQLLMAYSRIKKDQEEDDACNAVKSSHLKPGGCSVSVATVVYPEHIGSSIHQLFTKNIACGHKKYSCSCQTGTSVLWSKCCMICYFYYSYCVLL